MRVGPQARRKDRYHHGDLRSALLRAALALISKKGVEGFSLREAARAVGVSPAAAYRHFEDRSALLAALALEGKGRLAAEMEQAIARAPGIPGTPQRAAAELRGMCAAYVEFAVANPSCFRVMFGPWCNIADREALSREVFPAGRDPYELLVYALDALVRTGGIAPEARQGAEITVWASVHGLASQLAQGSLQFTHPERVRAYEVIERTLLLGFGASPSLLGPAPDAPALLPRRANQLSSDGPESGQRLSRQSPSDRETPHPQGGCEDRAQRSGRRERGPDRAALRPRIRR